MVDAEEAGFQAAFPGPGKAQAPSAFAPAAAGLFTRVLLGAFRLVRRLFAASVFQKSKPLSWLRPESCRTWLLLRDSPAQVWPRRGNLPDPQHLLTFLLLAHLHRLNWSCSSALEQPADTLSACSVQTLRGSAEYRLLRTLPGRDNRIQSFTQRSGVALVRLEIREQRQRLLVATIPIFPADSRQSQRTSDEFHLCC